jgi:hypothetical protein
VQGAERVPLVPDVYRTRAKALSKHLSRQVLKALRTHLGRFEDEPLEVRQWRHGILRAANRFGLIVAGDLACASRALAPAEVLGADAMRVPEAHELILFALGERYIALRREVGLGSER